MPNKKLPYYFILGMSHSGSTLLAFLLNTHPRVVTVGETSRINELLPTRWQKDRSSCSCGLSFYNCAFWNQALAGLAARGYGLGTPDFFKYERGEKNKADDKLRAIVEAMLEVSNAKIFLDASKHAYCVTALARNPHIDLHIIDLYRDGRGVVNSWRKNRDDGTTEKIVTRFVRQEYLRQSALSLVPKSKVLKVKYEDLAQSPEETLQTIFKIMGVRANQFSTEGFKTQVEHHIIGNKMRLNSMEEIIFDEKWRKELPKEWRDSFTRVGGMQINEQNGYSD